ACWICIEPWRIQRSRPGAATRTCTTDCHILIRRAIPLSQSKVQCGRTRTHLTARLLRWWRYLVDGQMDRYRSRSGLEGNMPCILPRIEYTYKYANICISTWVNGAIRRIYTEPWHIRRGRPGGAAAATSITQFRIVTKRA